MCLNRCMKAVYALGAGIEPALTTLTAWRFTIKLPQKIGRSIKKLSLAGEFCFWKAKLTRARGDYYCHCCCS